MGAEATLDPVGQIVEDFASRYRRGQRPSITDYAQRHPDLAERLREVLPMVALMEQAAPCDATQDGPPAASPQAMPERLGGYRIVREIGRGGMGIVYEAEQIALGRQVALKVLPMQAARAGWLERFRREARAAARLHHTNIVPVYEVGEDGDQCFFAMQFIPGQPLDQVLNELRQQRSARSDPTKAAHSTDRIEQVPSSVAETGKAPSTTVTLPGSADLSNASTSPRHYQRSVVNIGIQVAEALDHAHREGVVHRDIKPSNLLLDTDGRVWVADFGLAKTEESVRTSGDFIGTLRYMAPERFRGCSDARSDIYSLGLTLYEMLVLQPAFAADDHAVLLQEILGHAPPALRRVDPRIACDLETIVTKAIDPERSRRYQTASELAADLRRFLEDRPIRARRPSIPSRLTKFGRRNKWAVLAAAAVVLGLVAGIFAMTWGLALAERQRRIAAENEQRAVLAAEAENRTRQAAAARAAETDSVLEFVESQVLAAARPDWQEAGLGRDVTLRKAVETALPFLDQRFRDQPLIEARLRLMLGTSLRHWGQPQGALQQHNIACDLFTHYHGPDHLDTLKSRMALAQAYGSLGRHSEALHLQETALPLLQVRLGPDHLETHRCMHMLASSYSHMGRHEEALQLQATTLPRMKANLGLNHADTLECMMGLAKRYSHLGRHAEALDLHSQTLALTKARLGPDHPQTLLSMSNLAKSYAHLGRHAEAFELHNQALALTKATLGPDHPQSLSSMNSLAKSYSRLGRHAEAIELHNKTLTLMKATLGPDHPNTLKCMQALASSYASLGRHAEALNLLEETLALRAIRLGLAHPHTLGSMNDLARLLATCPDTDYRNPKRAVELASNVVELAPNEGSFWSTLGLGLYRAADFDTAIETLGKSMELRSGGDSFDWFHLAMAHWQLGNLNDARRWNQKAIAWMEERPSCDQKLGCIRAEVEQLLKSK